MTLRARRDAVVHAERACDKERTRWRACTSGLQRRLERHRSAWLVGGGLASGLLAGLLPWRAGARITRLAMSAADVLLRSSMGVALIEAMRRGLLQTGSSEGRRDSKEAGHASGTDPE